MLIMYTLHSLINYKVLSTSTNISLNNRTVVVWGIFLHDKLVHLGELFRPSRLLAEPIVKRIWKVD